MIAPIESPHTPPEPETPRRRRRLPWWLRFIGGFLLGMGIALLLALGTLRIPRVQTWAVSYLSDWAQRKTGFDVRFGKVYLNFYDNITLYDVLVIDKEGRRMIEVPELSVDFAIHRVLRREVALDNVLARDGHVRIITSKRTGQVNITQFVDSLTHWINPDTARNPNPPNFYIFSAGLSGFEVTISDERKDSIRTGFDYRHMHFAGLTAIVENFRARADTIELNLPLLRARDTETDWEMHKLTTQFRITRHDMTFAPFKLWLGHSYLSDTLQFRFEKKADMADFVQKVTVRGNLKDSRIDYRDLALFSEAMGRLHDTVKVDHARVRGKVTDFTIDQMAARFGKASQLIGKVRMAGLPEFWTTNMDIALRPSYVEPADLHQYLPEVANTYLARMGPTDFEGTYKGTPTDFGFKGGVYGRNGTFLTDMEMHLHGPERSTYAGTFTAKNLALGAVLNQKDVLGTMTGSGEMKGKGFTLASALMDVKGRFDEFDLYGYRYRHIVSDATLARQQFDGMLSVRDTNLMADLNGLVDLSKPRKVFDMDLDLRRARLKPLGWTKRSVVLTGKAFLKGSGSDADDAEGLLRLDSSAITVDGQRVAVDSLELETLRPEGHRSIRLSSDYVAGTMEGDFTFRAIAADLEAGLNDYGRLFNNQTALRNHTAFYSHRDYTAALRLNLRDLTPLLKLAVPGVQVAKKAVLTADITKSTNFLVQTDLQADYLAYGQSVFDAVRVDLATSKTIGSPNVLASASVSSPSQRFGNLVTKGLNIEGVWSGGVIDFSTAIAQDNDSNYIDLKGDLGFLPGRLVARLNSADIRLLDSTWRVSPHNRLVFDGVRLGVDSLSFATNGQRVEVYGMAGPSMLDTLHVGVDSLSASFVKAFLNGHYTGKASASVELAGLLSKTGSIFGKTSIQNLTRDGLALGDISARIVPQVADASLLVELGIDKDSVPLLRGGGVIRPGSLDKQLDLNFRLTQTPLAYLAPLFTGTASGWAGSATGHLALDGTLDQPVLTGAAFLNGGAVTVDYLKTRYYFDDTVRLSHGLISATGATLRDVYGHTAHLTKAEVRHKYFKEFYIDMQGDTKGLQLLGTTYKDSKLYYGNAYATGQLGIKGPIGDIVISANMKTDRGTRLYLPMQSALATNTQQQNYISLCHPCDTLRADSASRARADSLQEARDRVNLTGLRLNFNIEVTPDAIGEVIFDRQTGDAITVAGHGRMKLNVDTRGEFTMLGRYNITSGTYKFTFANVIDKTFDILDGSSITWNGDPAQGQLDIQARYFITAPFSPLTIGLLTNQPDSATIAAEAQRRYPVNVNMNLTGPMLQPTIGLGLDIPNQYPSSLSRYVLALQGLIQSSEQELNKQVFSLLLLRSFSPTGLGGYASASSGVGNLSELLSNQLSAWLSEVNKNLEVGVNLAGFNQASLDNFQLRLSYTALDGRLRVTRNGAFTNTASQTTAASLAGDWTLEYYLTRDGKLRLKAFHRTNQTLVNTGIGQGISTTSQGISVLHTQSFNNLRELMPWLYRTKPNPLLKQRETAPSSNTVPVQTPAPPPAQPVTATPDVSKEPPPSGKPTAAVQPK